jgi:hypothetical protein
MSATGTTYNRLLIIKRTGQRMHPGALSIKCKETGFVVCIFPDGGTFTFQVPGHPASERYKSAAECISEALDAILIPYDAVCSVEKRFSPLHILFRQFPLQFVFKSGKQALVPSPKRARTDEPVSEEPGFVNPLSEEDADTMLGKEGATVTLGEEKIDTMVIFVPEDDDCPQIAVFTANQKTTECFIRVAQTKDGRCTLSSLMHEKIKLIETTPETPFDYKVFYPYSDDDDDDEFEYAFGADYGPHFKNATWTFKQVQGVPDPSNEDRACDVWALNDALSRLRPMKVIVLDQGF